MEENDLFADSAIVEIWASLNAVQLIEIDFGGGYIKSFLANPYVNKLNFGKVSFSNRINKVNNSENQFSFVYTLN